MKTVRAVPALLLFGVTLLGSFRAIAQPIAVPNFSFESQTAPPFYPYVNTSVDSWQKAPEPAYWPSVQTNYGIPWNGTAGVFLDVNPYVNHDGSQVGYILNFPGVALFQDYSTSATHDFNVTYTVGRSYNMTIGVFGKDSLTPGSTLQLSVYYRDNSDNIVNVSSTTLTYSSDAFPMSTNSPLSLIDFNVNVPTVQASDAWAGQHMGIELLSNTPLGLSSAGNWDFDNVRLTETPEPACGSLLALAAGSFWLRNKRVHRG